MLTLTRKPLESIRIGPEITITIIRATSGRVQLAIDAPLNLKILRTELLDAAPSLLPRAGGEGGRRPDEGSAAPVAAPTMQEALE